jgi:hypothetical protein
MRSHKAWTPALLGAAWTALAITGCARAPIESRLTVFNANPYRVTVTVPSSTVAFSIGACTQAEFTWVLPGGWKAESGADGPDGSRPLVPLYSRGPGGDEGPAQIVDIVSGTSYLEYAASETPSFPPCSAPTSPVATSG